jgi:UDP-glucose-4-epimerase GalE
MSALLVTGGAGFVGSHVVRAACDAGSRVVVLDDLSGGPLPRLPASARFVRGDIADRALVAQLLDHERIAAVVHCAGKISVAESITNPARYFETNVTKTLALLDAVVRAGVRPIVFSSSAAVYGDTGAQPIPETAPVAPVNPYGATKVAVEHALAAYGAAYGLPWAALRYFNAAGAHPDGTLREAHAPETHLIPLVVDAATSRGRPLTIFGDDYPTPDGTCIRDYVHVCDLADAHLAALGVLARGPVGAINLGSGRGYSVREVIDSCARVVGRAVPNTVAGRRPGDAPALVASIDRARAVLGWTPRHDTLELIVEDAVRSRR